ncbi:TolC family protein [Rapidithrix thailandica]|uniref:TolC family protein n=1 Tax=Rapidithrix thailandica TaxID=413964 RepID=A0AAW9S2I9_9BACT
MHYLLLLMLGLPLAALGQDSTTEFTQEQLIWFVKKYHPVSVQGALFLKEGESTVRKARGAFDPYLFTQLDQKYFKDKTYFSILNGGLKVPTWYGVEVKAEFEKNKGLFLNPENKVPLSGLWKVGVSVPIGKGLFIDKRRAILKQAKLFAESVQAEQQKLMNDLYYDAIQHYWKWVGVWHQYQIYVESVQLALTRFNAVKQSFLLGDKPAIDTLEAFIHLQNRMMDRNQYQLLYQGATLEMSTFLWFENNTPLEITDSLRPPVIEKINLINAVSSDTLETFLTQLEATHPEMQLYRYQLTSMKVEKRLKIEGLKPKINLNYMLLNEPSGVDFINGLSSQNYKWGVEFGFPLFLRQQRGDLQLTQLKMQKTELGQQQKLLELQNKVKDYYNKQISLQEQVVLFTGVVNNYRRLLQGERQKFNNGESSLFLINSRERDLIQARAKLIELLVNFNTARMGLYWAVGRLY